MPTKTNKTYASFYGNDLSVNQSSNTGVDSTTRAVQDGFGNNTVISLSDDVLQVQPVNDDTTRAFMVRNSGGTIIFSVNSVDDLVYVNQGQVAANTQYLKFNSFYIVPVAGYHMIVSQGTAEYTASGMEEIDLGNGTDPATTLDVSAETVDAMNLVSCYWYVTDDISIDGVTVLMGGSAAAGDALGFHLMSYAIDTTTNFGDLSGGTVVADGGAGTDVDEDKVIAKTMSVQSADVAGGRVMLATVESDSTDPIAVQMIVKYHIQ